MKCSRSEREIQSHTHAVTTHPHIVLLPSPLLVPSQPRLLLLREQKLKGIGIVRAAWASRSRSRLPPQPNPTLHIIRVRAGVSPPRPRPLAWPAGASPCGAGGGAAAESRPAMAIRRPEAASFLPLTLLFSIAFICARFLLDRLVYKPLAVYLFNSKASKLMNDEAGKGKIVKFSESIWKLTYYGSVQAWVLLIIKQEPWSLDTMQYFDGWPNQPIPSSLTLFYMCQCGFYIYSIGALIAWETRRKDFAVMMSHHVITSILIGYSYLSGFFRIGTIILALHDASDVFLETAKLCKYTEKELGASLFFGLFAISWLLLRLVYFPFWIIKTSSYQSIIFLRKLDRFPSTLYYVFNTMLLTLLVFHMYWWKLICLMIMRQLNNKGQVGEDVRSDSEDEE